MTYAPRTHDRLRRGGFFLAVALALAWLAWSSFDARSGALLQTTGMLAICVALIALPWAALTAVLLSRCDVPGRGFWETCLLVLIFMPLYVQVAAWEAGFGRGGWYSTIVAGKLSDPPLAEFRGAVWVHSVAAVPWLYWLLRLGLAAVPPECEDAARLDATPRQVLWWVTLPLAMPTLAAGALWVLIGVATEITATDIYQVRTYAEELYNAFALGTTLHELPLRFAPAMMMLTVLVVSGLGLCHALWPAVVGPSRSRRLAVGPARWVALIVIALLVLPLLLVPVGNLLYHAGVDVRQVAAQRERHWSLHKLGEVLLQSPYGYRRELAWSALLAQLSALAAVSWAVAMGLWAQRSKWRQYVAALLSVVCFVVPGPFIGLGILWMRNLSQPSWCIWLYDDTVFAPWLALTLRSFPLVYLVVWFGLQSVPRQTIQCAKLDGAGAFRCFLYVILPQLLPALVCAGLVAMAISLGDLSASVLVIPPGVMTVAIRVFNLVHYGAEDELAGLCLTSIMLMLLLAMLSRLALIHLFRARRGLG